MPAESHMVTLPLNSVSDLRRPLALLFDWYAPACGKVVWCPDCGQPNQYDMGTVEVLLSTIGPIRYASGNQL
jgi:hypothetical protein